MQSNNVEATGTSPRLFCVAYWKKDGGWQIHRDVTAANIADDMRRFPGFIFDRAEPLSQVKSCLFSRMHLAGVMPA